MLASAGGAALERELGNAGDADLMERPQPKKGGDTRRLISIVGPPAHQRLEGFIRDYIHSSESSKHCVECHPADETDDRCEGHQATGLLAPYRLRDLGRHRDELRDY